MNHNDLRILLHSNVGLIVVETYDESRALTLLREAFQRERLPVWSWSCSEGIKSLGAGLSIAPRQEQQSCKELKEALEYIKNQRSANAFILCDAHPFLDEPVLIRLLKDIALSKTPESQKVILLSHRLKLPPELSRYAASLSMSLPSEEEILALIREEAKQWSRSQGGGRIRTDQQSLQKLVNNLKGLPHQDVRRLARGAIADDGAISESDLPEVTKAKFALMDMDGILHFEYSTAHLKDVAGLERLKVWLEHHKQGVLSEKQGQLDAPKGVLLFGVQGGGKSLAAKAIAGIWGLPLLRLDMAGLFNKYIGETEKNLREALKLADVMAPCVLWLDEIEKGLAQNEGDNAIAKRLLGTLLTWMSERRSKVFMVATSNNISELPPELMRKGRFDEIFFVDLPKEATRRRIFEIHFDNRQFDSHAYDMEALALQSEGFTGAEIEQTVVGAAYAASARDEVLQTSHVQEAIANTQPLSVVMAEKMAALRTWAADRAVPAD